MPVRIRLQRHGAKKRPFYFIVVADSRAPRDGRYIEKLGIYNPLTIPATIEINRDRSTHWLQQGAQASDTAHRILSFSGVLFWKHLLRGVKLGLFDLAKAQEKYDEWKSKHTNLIQGLHEKHIALRKDQVAKVEEEVIARAKAKADSKLQEKNAAPEVLQEIRENQEEQNELNNQ